MSMITVQDLIVSEKLDREALICMRGGWGLNSIYHAVKKRARKTVSYIYRKTNIKTKYVSYNPLFGVFRPRTYARIGN